MYTVKDYQNLIVQANKNIENHGYSCRICPRGFYCHEAENLFDAYCNLIDAKDQAEKIFKRELEERGLCVAM